LDDSWPKSGRRDAARCALFLLEKMITVYHKKQGWSAGDQYFSYSRAHPKKTFDYAFDGRRRKAGPGSHAHIRALGTALTFTSGSTLRRVSLGWPGCALYQMTRIPYNWLLTFTCTVVRRMGAPLVAG
jgi:hypothetical protein